ncbi:MAG: hypothetical protein K2X93_04485, partial [Candidatus Obscuribacterales bacterium]|nr:hypothetical protein [Candidatus Obscuribacterales bacterium]
MSQVTARQDSLAITQMQQPFDGGGDDGRFLNYKVLRRNGNVADFQPHKVSVAMTKAFLAVEGAGGEESSKIREVVRKLTEQVVETLLQRLPNGGVFHIEHIQDQVEIALMRNGEHEVARGYVLYRNERAQERSRQSAHDEPVVTTLRVTAADGNLKPLDKKHLYRVAQLAAAGLDSSVSPEKIVESSVAGLYDGVKETDVMKSLIFSARALIEQEPDYTYVSARLLLHDVRREVLGEEVDQDGMDARYCDYFKTYIQRGMEAGLLDEKLEEYDLDRIGSA